MVIAYVVVMGLAAFGLTAWGLDKPLRLRLIPSALLIAFGVVWWVVLDEGFDEFAWFLAMVALILCTTLELQPVYRRWRLTRVHRRA